MCGLVRLGVMMYDGALLDTSFFLRFLNENDPLFERANRYYKFFLQKEIKLFISTISIAEYCVGGAVDELPLKNLIVVPFNILHATKAGNFARLLYEAKKKSELILSERHIIINDAKLFAQADTDARIKYYITSDKRSFGTYNTIKNQTNINFDFIDIAIEHTEVFGILDF